MSSCVQSLSAVVQWVMLPTIHSEHLGSRMCQLAGQDPPSPSGRLCRLQPASFTGVHTTCAVNSKARDAILTGRCVLGGGGSITPGTVGRQGEIKQNQGPSPPLPNLVSHHSPFFSYSGRPKRPAFSFLTVSYPISCQV